MKIKNWIACVQDRGKKKKKKKNVTCCEEFTVRWGSLKMVSAGTEKRLSSN